MPTIINKLFDMVMLANVAPTHHQMYAAENLRSFHTPAITIQHFKALCNEDNILHADKMIYKKDYEEATAAGKMLQTVTNLQAPMHTSMSQTEGNVLFC